MIEDIHEIIKKNTNNKEIEKIVLDIVNLAMNMYELGFTDAEKVKDALEQKYKEKVSDRNE